MLFSIHVRYVDVLSLYVDCDLDAGDGIACNAVVRCPVGNVPVHDGAVRDGVTRGEQPEAVVELAFKGAIDKMDLRLNQEVSTNELRGTDDIPHRQVGAIDEDQLTEL